MKVDGEKGLCVVKIRWKGARSEVFPGILSLFGFAPFSVLFVFLLGAASFSTLSLVFITFVLDLDCIDIMYSSL